MPFKSEKQRRFMWAVHPDIAERWSHEMHKNPLRQHTNTMLPDDARAFDFLPWDDDVSRSFRIRGSKLTHPSGKEVNLTKLGKGYASTAYQGDDGWVYLVTSEDSGDKSKEILSELPTNEKTTKHIPYVEAIGYIRKSPNHEDWVYRMPFYRKITAKDKAAWSQLKQLKKLIDQVSFIRNPNYLQDCIDKVEESSIEESLKIAFISLAEHLQNYEGEFVFEMPSGNLSVDEDGNLVLLDVFFDRIALIKFRERKRAVYRNPPSEGFEWLARGSFAKVYRNGDRVEAIIEPIKRGDKTQADLSKDIICEIRDKVSENAKRFLPEITRKAQYEGEFVYEMPYYEKPDPQYAFLDTYEFGLDKTNLDYKLLALKKFLPEKDVEGISEAMKALKHKTESIGARFLTDFGTRNIVSKGNQLILLDCFSANGPVETLVKRWRKNVR